jgi:hypothetical protein
MSLLNLSWRPERRRIAGLSLIVALLALAGGGGLIHATNVAVASPAIGTSTVYAPVGGNPAGYAQAYRYTGVVNGTTDSLSIYLDGSNTATAVALGLYSGTSSAPSTLTRACTISSPQAGAWNSCAVTPQSVTSGTYYWIAVLQPSGATGNLNYREGQITGGPNSYLAASSPLSALPATWTSGGTFTGGYIASLFAGASTTTSTPTAAPTPTPISISGVPCTVTLNNVQQTGTCSGTFTPKTSATPTPAPTATPKPTATPTATPKPTATPAPTPAPTPTPAPSGSFPNASNTGVPTGTVLHSCNPLITVTGTYDACHFVGDVVVKANNVKITRSLISGGVDAGSGFAGQQTGLVISDTEINCGCPSTTDTSTPSAIMESNYTLLRVNLHNSGHGASVADNVTIQDSWIHGLGNNTEAHKDAIYSGNGVNVVLRHNNIECNDGPLAGCTSAIGLLSDFGPESNWVIDNNLLNTIGAYCFYGGGGPQKPYHSDHITFTNNHFGRAVLPNCGAYGPVTYWDASQPGMVWSGNVWDDTGAPVAPEY